MKKTALFAGLGVAALGFLMICGGIDTTFKVKKEQKMLVEEAGKEQEHTAQRKYEKVTLAFAAAIVCSRNVRPETLRHSATDICHAADVLARRLMVVWERRDAEAKALTPVAQEPDKASPTEEEESDELDK